MPLADIFRQQAEALNAAAEASDRLDGSLDRLTRTEAGILALQRQAAAQARTAPARLLGPDGRPVQPAATLGAADGPFEPLPAFLQPRTTSGPAGGAGVSGIATGTGGGGGKSRTGSLPFDLIAANKCELKTVPMPDGTTREVWDCRKAAGDESAIYFVPKYVTATRGARIGKSGGGSGGGGLSGTPFAFPERRTVFGGTEPPGTAFVGLGSSAPATPTPGEREIVRAISTQTARLEGELRQIRQDGQRYRGGVDLRAGGLV